MKVEDMMKEIYIQAISVASKTSKWDKRFEGAHAQEHRYIYITQENK